MRCIVLYIVFSVTLNGLSQDIWNTFPNCQIHPKRFPVSYYLSYEEWERICFEVSDLLVNNKYKENPACLTIADKIIYNYKGIFHVQLDTSFCNQQLRLATGISTSKIEYLPRSPVSIEKIEKFSEFIGDNNYVDGEYCVMYQPYYSLVDTTWIFDRAFAQFKLINNRLNGDAVFFSINGDTIAKGRFIDSFLHGEWNFKFKKHGVGDFSYVYDGRGPYYSFTIDYVYNSRTGRYVCLNEDTLVASGFLKNGIPIGKWAIYHSNGLLSNSFTLIEKSSHLGKRNFCPIIQTEKDNLPCGNEKLIIPYFLGQDDLFIYPFEHSVETGIRESSIVGEFKSYYESGAPFLITCILCDSISSVPDTAFYENGKPMKVWIPNRRGTGGIVYSYDRDGKLDHTYKKK
ncbi:MAG: hypothetical protein IPM74_01255 [Crocinitomicaceae bacterium]|nr:hypothetical protein [Crocinitomicaceae bacterium]MBK8924544.1 hypothetical protein [Crocinitomicaceae bacterium]